MRDDRKGVPWDARVVHEKGEQFSNREVTVQYTLLLCMGASTWTPAQLQQAEQRKQVWWVYMSIARCQHH